MSDLDGKVGDFADAIHTVINDGYFLCGSSPNTSSPGREGRLYGIGTAKLIIIIKNRVTAAATQSLKDLLWHFKKFKKLCF